MSLIRFTSQTLERKGKEGILPADSYGYRTTVLGGLNVVNSTGHYYVAEGVTQLFEGSSILMRKIQNGNLRSEWAHPQMEPNMTDDAFLRRALGFDSNKECAHISEVWLDMEFGKNNPEFNSPPMIGIFGKVKPSGPYGKYLEDSFNNPKENTNFSIRVLYKEFFQRGVRCRAIEHIITWDAVPEPGIAAANKWASPALEGHAEITIPPERLKRVAASIVNSRYAMESDKQMCEEILRDLGESYKIANIPAFSKW